MFKSYCLHNLESLQCSRAIQSVIQIHIVFDRYKENSLRFQTRQNRGDTGASKQ